MKTLNEIIRSHFHGFSDDQWNKLKKEFPYSEIPHILNDYSQQLHPTDSEIWEWANYIDGNILSYLFHDDIHTMDELKHRIIGRLEGAKAIRDNKIPHKS